MITIKKIKIDEDDYYYMISKLAVSMIANKYTSEGVKMSFRDVLGYLRSFKRVYIDDDISESEIRADSGVVDVLESNRFLIGENIDGTTVKLLDGYYLRQIQSSVIIVKKVIKYGIDDIVLIGKGNENNYGKIVDIKHDYGESGEDELKVRYGNKVVKVMTPEVMLICRAKNREDFKSKNF